MPRSAMLARATVVRGGQVAGLDLRQLQGHERGLRKMHQPVRQSIIRKDNFKNCSMCFLKNWKKLEKAKHDYVES